MDMTENRQMVVNVATGEKRPAISNMPLTSSAGAPWSDVLIEEHSGTAVDLDYVAPEEHVIVVQLKRTCVFDWKENGCYRTMRLQPGQTSIFPAMVPFSTRSHDTGGFLTMTLRQKFLRCASHELMTAPDALELTPRLAVDDPLFTALGATLKAEVHAGYAGGRAYGDALAGTLAVHLVRHYSNRRSQPAGEGTRLSRHQLRRAVDFMHDQLAESLSLNAVAAEAGLSVFHFARLFKQTTGLAPHQYLIQCRVERAKQLIVASSASTAEIAQQVGFCDQSHLTVHFRRLYGVTPKSFRAQMGQRQERA